MQPVPRALATRWLAAHLGASVAVELFFSILAPGPLFPADLWNGHLAIPAAVTQGLRIGIGQAIAFSWIRLPVPWWIWGTGTSLAAGFGHFLAIQAERTLTRLIYDVWYSDQFWWPEPTPYADLVMPFTQAFLLAATQGVVLACWVGRKQAIVWGSFALAGWFVVDLLFCFGLKLEPLMLQHLKIEQLGSLPSQCLNGVWMVLFSAFMLPAVPWVFHGHRPPEAGAPGTPTGDGPTSTAPR